MRTAYGVERRAYNLQLMYAPLACLRALLLTHEGVPVLRRRHERLLDRPCAHPAHEVHLGAGLVVGAAAARTAEGLLAHGGARRLVVHVEVAGRAAQRR